MRRTTPIRLRYKHPKLFDFNGSSLLKQHIPQVLSDPTPHLIKHFLGFFLLLGNLMYISLVGGVVTWGVWDGREVELCKGGREVRGVLEAVVEEEDFV